MWELFVRLKNKSVFQVCFNKKNNFFRKFCRLLAAGRSFPAFVASSNSKTSSVDVTSLNAVNSNAAVSFTILNLIILPYFSKMRFCCAGQLKFLFCRSLFSSEERSGVWRKFYFASAYFKKVTSA